MSLRGFAGEYNSGAITRPCLKDFAYLACWSLFFIAARIYNIPILIGSILVGVIK
jgi:cobalt/nickel transport system permease protein